MDGTQQSLQCCAIKIAVIITDILESFLDELTKQSKGLASVGSKSSQNMRKWKKPRRAREEALRSPFLDQEGDMETESCPKDGVMFLEEVPDEFVDHGRSRSRRRRSISPMYMEKGVQRSRPAMYEKCIENITIPSQETRQSRLDCLANMTCQPQTSSWSQGQVYPCGRTSRHGRQPKRSCSICAPCQLRTHHTIHPAHVPWDIMDIFQNPACQRAMADGNELNLVPPPTYNSYNNAPRNCELYPFPGLSVGQLFQPGFSSTVYHSPAAFQTPPALQTQPAFQNPSPSLGTTSFQVLGPDPNLKMDNNCSPPIQNMPANNQLGNNEETLNKTVEVTVNGIEKIMKHWDKAIDTSKQEYPENVDEKCKILAAKLMNKNHRLEDLRAGIDDMLTQLQGVLLNSSPYNHWVLQECLDNIVRRSIAAKCPDS